MPPSNIWKFAEGHFFLLVQGKYLLNRIWELKEAGTKSSIVNAQRLHLEVVKLQTRSRFGCRMLTRLELTLNPSSAFR